MPALGIGAGAFEGDNERKQQQQRDAQLGLQAASLQQQGRQADMADSRARMGMALDQQNRRAELAFGKERMGEQSRQFDAGLGMDQQRQAEQRRQFDTSTQMQGQEQQRRAQMDAFDQKQTLRKNDWEDVAMSMKRKQFELEYSELKKVADEANRKREEKANVLSSWQGKMIRYALENQVVPPEVIEQFNKATGNTVAQVFSDGNGGVMFKRLVKDPQTGQEVLRDIYADPDYVSTIKGDLGLATVSDPVKNRYMMERGDSLADRGEKTMSRLDEIRYKTAAEILTKNESDTATMQKALKDMQDIEAFYGRGIQRQQETQPPAQEKPSPERSVIQGAQQQRTSQPTMSKTAYAVKNFILTSVPKEQHEQLRAKIEEYDPKNEEDYAAVLKYLQDNWKSQVVEPKQGKQQDQASSTTTQPKQLSTEERAQAFANTLAQRGVSGKEMSVAMKNSFGEKFANLKGVASDQYSDETDSLLLELSAKDSTIGAEAAAFADSLKKRGSSSKQISVAMRNMYGSRL